MKRKRVGQIASIFLATIALILASCRRGESDGVSFVVNNGAEPQSLDPALMSGVPEFNLYTALFEGLMVADPRTARPVKGLAESWTVSDDGLVYTFKLRDATWSDGAPITAGDFEYSLKRVLDPKTAATSAYMPGDVIKGAAAYTAGTGKPEDVGIEALDDKTLEFTLVSPCAYFLELLEHHSFAPTPKAAIEKFGSNWMKVGNIVSNGPFVLAEWSPQKRIVMTKNPLYWDRDNVKLDRIVFLPIDDNSTAYNMYKNGEIDWNTTPSKEIIDELVTREDYHADPGWATYYFGANVTRKPFDNVDVRKAMAMAIDTKILVEQVTKGGEQATTALVPPLAGYVPAQGNAFNPDTARALLAKAGFPLGKGFPKFSILYNTDGGNKMIAEFIQNQWKTHLGLDATLRNQEWKTFLSSRSNLDFDVVRIGWSGDYLDPLAFLALFANKGGNNTPGYESSEYSALIKEATRMPAGAERNRVMNGAEELLVTRDQAIMPLFVYVIPHLIDTEKWGGWHTNLMDYHWWKFIYKK